MKRVILSVFLIMIIISFASATAIPSILTAQNTCVNLQQTIASATQCLITVQDPINNTAIIDSDIMTKVGDIYNYNFCNTTDLGDYIVITQCNPNGVLDNPIPYTLRVTSTGKEFSMMDISVYIFFLLVCLMILIFSVRLIKENSMQKDEMDDSKLYEMKKRNEVKFYLELLKKKMWIIGLFGIYLSILIFLSMLAQLIFSLGLNELNRILTNIVIVLLWGLVPFTLFWIVYIIIYIYKSTEVILRHQFGNFRVNS